MQQINKEEEENSLIENTPNIKEKKCIFFAYLIFFSLVIAPVLLSLYVWMQYDILIAIGSLIFFYLVSSIITSKLRVMSIPRDQQERSFSTLEIAKWYVSRNLCF
jgi:hypothetical protein